MTIDISDLVRPSVKRLKPFSSARAEYEGSAEVFLDANENPFDSTFNRYPDPFQKSLKEVISSLKNVSSSNIFLGNGSDEIIDIIVRTFCEPRKDRVRYIHPSFGMYEVVADINDVLKKSIPLGSEFKLSKEICTSDQTEIDKILFLCSPNNPTGNSLPKDDLLDIISDFKGIVVVDEAYIDFSEEESLIKDLDQYPNLIILQTLSKAYGAAGLRIGMAFASEKIISYLNKIKPPYNIGTVTQNLAESLLKDSAKAIKEIDIIKSERQRIFQVLADMKVVKKIYPSDANFFLIQFENALKVLKYLQGQDIIVRDRSKLPGCEECLRVTIGTPEENDRLLQVLKKYTYAESTVY